MTAKIMLDLAGKYMLRLFPFFRRSLLCLLLAPLAMPGAELYVGMEEEALLAAKGTPDSILSSRTKKILRWSDLVAETEEGTVSKLTSIGVASADLITAAEIDLVDDVEDMQNRINRAEGLSFSDYLELSALIIDRYNKESGRIANTPFRYELERYIRAHVILRDILQNMSWSKTATNESFFLVRRTRDPQAYQLVSEIPQKEQKKIIGSWADGGQAFEIYDLNAVSSHINSVYWTRAISAFQENLSRFNREVVEPSLEAAGSGSPLESRRPGVISAEVRIRNRLADIESELASNREAWETETEQGFQDAMQAYNQKRASLQESYAIQKASVDREIAKIDERLLALGHDIINTLKALSLSKKYSLRAYLNSEKPEEVIYFISREEATSGKNNEIARKAYVYSDQDVFFPYIYTGFAIHHRTREEIHGFLGEIVALNKAKNSIMATLPPPPVEDRVPVRSEFQPTRMRELLREKILLEQDMQWVESQLPSGPAL